MAGSSELLEKLKFGFPLAWFLLPWSCFLPPLCLGGRLVYLLECYSSCQRCPVYFQYHHCVCCSTELHHRLSGLYISILLWVWKKKESLTITIKIHLQDSGRNVHRRGNVLKFYSRQLFSHVLISTLSDSLREVAATGDQMKHTAILNYGCLWVWIL